MVSLKRNRTIDLAKGISILIVVWFHCHERWGMGLGVSSVNFTDQMISFFFMPIFFILSGMTLNPEKTMKEIFQKSFDKLLIPYIIFCILSVIYCLPIKYRQPEFPFYERLHISFPFITAWFLMTLFWARLLFITIIKSTKQLYLISLAVILLSVIGYCIGEQRMMFRSDTALTVQVYLLIGYLMNRFKIYKQNSCYLNIVLIVISIVPLIYISRTHTEEIAYVVNVYKVSYFILILGALLGSICILSISKLLKKQPAIEFYGQNSLIVMLTHPLFLYILPYSLRLKCVELFGEQTYIYIFILIAIIEYPTIVFCNRYLPFIFGKNKISSFR